MKSLMVDLPLTKPLWLAWMRSYWRISLSRCCRTISSYSFIKEGKTEMMRTLPCLGNCDYSFDRKKVLAVDRYDGSWFPLIHPSKTWDIFSLRAGDSLSAVLRRLSWRESTPPSLPLAILVMATSRSLTVTSNLSGSFGNHGRGSGFSP